MQMKLIKKAFIYLIWMIVKGKGHWSVLYYYSLQSYNNDSFGFVPPLQVENKIQPYIYNDNNIQDFNSSARGHYFSLY